MKIDKIATNFQLAHIALQIFNSPTCKNSAGCENCKGRNVCEFLNQFLDFIDEA